MILPKPVLTFLLTAVSLTGIIILYFVKPIPQDQSFHQFADTRSILGINNFWNAISNIGFLIVGLAALQKIIAGKLIIPASIKTAFVFFFTGILLVSAGSAWYHYNPNNATLVWDRLPMTIAFMSLLSIGIAEFLSTAMARITLFPFLFAGIVSIVYWQYSEWHHHGDLRPYALVQYLPVLLLSILFVFSSSVYDKTYGYLILFATYLVAKLAEHFDTAVYHATHELISGHFLKHIITAAGLWWFLLYLQHRKTLG